jgi:hypothetical protein
VTVTVTVTVTITPSGASVNLALSEREKRKRRVSPAFLYQWVARYPSLSINVRGFGKCFLKALERGLR